MGDVRAHPSVFLLAECCAVLCLSHRGISRSPRPYGHCACTAASTHVDVARRAQPNDPIEKTNYAMRTEGGKVRPMAKLPSHPLAEMNVT